MGCSYGIRTVALAAPSGMRVGINFGQSWLPGVIACSQAGAM